MDDDKEMWLRLYRILETNRNATARYLKAAEHAKSMKLRDFFKERSSERASFNTTLDEAWVGNLEGLAENSDLKGTVHRAWMDVKSIFPGNNEASMLRSTLRGDRAAIKIYEEVLNTGLPDKIMDILKEQKMSIEANLYKIKTLEDFV